MGGGFAAEKHGRAPIQFGRKVRMAAFAARLRFFQAWAKKPVLEGNMSFRVAAIPTKMAELVRTTLRSPGYGHPAHVEVAAGYGPCRHCLRTFDVGKENRILFTYDPFHGLESLPLPGPVFIHAEPCVRFTAEGFPEDLRNHRLTLAAYGAGRRLLTEEYVENGAVEPMIERLFGREDVQYLHVRDTEAGCYDFRIERGK